MKAFLKRQLDNALTLPNVFKQWRSTWGSLLVFFVPLLISIPKIGKFIDERNYLIYIIFFILFFAWSSANKKILQLADKERELESVKYKNATISEQLEATPELVIKHIFHQLNLTYKDRITIYRYNNTKDQFIPVGRYSISPQLSQKGRDEYPKDKGFIGQCWNHDGEVYKDNLPNYTNGSQRYLDEVSRIANMSKGTLRDISMKSRCYYCKSLFDNSHNPIAVIVIETLNASFGQKKTEIKDLITGQYGKLLTEAIERNLPLGTG